MGLLRLLAHSLDDAPSADAGHIVASPIVSEGAMVQAASDADGIGSNIGASSNQKRSFYGPNMEPDAAFGADVPTRIASSIVTKRVSPVRAGGTSAQKKRAIEASVGPLPIVKLKEYEEFFTRLSQSAPFYWL